MWNKQYSQSDFQGSSTVVEQPPPRRRRIETKESGDIIIVYFLDNRILDAANIQMIGEDLYSLVDELGHRKVLLNFSNVEYLSSAALGKIVMLNRKLQANAGKLAMCCINQVTQEVFQITHFDKFFAIAKDEAAGLQMF